jgi:hypothetical protein
MAVQERSCAHRLRQHRLVERDREDGCLDVQGERDENGPLCVQLRGDLQGKGQQGREEKGREKRRKKEGKRGCERFHLRGTFFSLSG